MEQVGSKKLRVLYIYIYTYIYVYTVAGSWLMWDVPSETTLPSFSFSTLMRHERSDQMEALARTLAQHGSGIVLLRQSHVAICCYQIMSYMIYIYIYVYMSYQINMFFRIFSRPGTPWSRSHDGWVGFWSTTSQGLWMTPVLAAIECNPALGAVEHQCQAHTISGQNIVALPKWSSPDSRFYTDWTPCSMDLRFAPSMLSRKIRHGALKRPEPSSLAEFLVKHTGPMAVEDPAMVGWPSTFDTESESE